MSLIQSLAVQYLSTNLHRGWSSVMAEIKARNLLISQGWNFQESQAAIDWAWENL